MNFLKQINRIKETHILILNEQTGNPEEFAIKLHISRSHLYNVLESLKDFGAVIKYSKKSESFYYGSPFDLELHYSLKIISNDETKEIFGGFLLRPTLLDGTLLYLQ
ncbi:hypothetical protein ACFPVY_09015 [Flavobacterium qiangtangense]|uniref:HTH domain-containing protein n=1 Tax=Flavobacterium qiangtangense TaxID=1442595 RepID=A0ABW1PMC2_9FLAO